MKILVCGGAGFIGSALVPALVAAGHEVTATVNSRDPAVKVPGVKYTEADLTARATWGTALQCAQAEAVFMCAGKTGGSGLDPLHFVTDNALMALQMYRSCVEYGVKRVVYMSSTTGYPEYTEDGLTLMQEDDYFTRDVHPAYFNPGHTKRFIERLSEMWAQKIETVAIRVAGVYGPHSDFDPKSSHVIEATIRKVAERQDPIILWGDGSAKRDALYITDLTDALLRSLDWPAGAYNLGTGSLMSVDAILHTLLAHADHQPRIERDLSKPQMIAVRRLECSKARALGWEPKVSMQDGLRMALDLYMAQCRP